MTDTSFAELRRLFERQKAAFAADRNPPLARRLDRLRRLDAAMIEFREPIRQAVAADFSTHHPLVTDLFESGAVIARSRYVQSMLAEWMAPAVRPLNPLVHGSSRAEVIRQPKGVLGNIAPWNFPIECALAMVADMLAAGNRVIVKSSELAPATARVLAEAVAAHFPEDELAVVSGGAELGARFASLPWDHLTYTGGARVGRLVMQAAAANLTPVTLELGGKNPTVFADDGLAPALVERFLYFRVFKGGQVCTSPDYALVPEGRLREWIDLAVAEWTRLYPRYVGHPDATGAINEHHYRRVLSLVEEARARGVEVISLNGDEPDPATRQIPMYVVVDPPDDLACMQDEIFGPVTPVKTYRTIEDAIARINSGPSPLASYLVTRDEELGRRFAAEVQSGGTGVNVFGFQAADPALPFGGVGKSGIGCHSGPEGFLNYSHSKSVFYCADDNGLAAAIRPPYAELTQAFADAVFTPAS
ncbi:MAG: aldehyde dehydrogenase family protein [Steroidobacteraceae bacterium]|jgi:coniferyl-aldehyde dehydrogenase|nr:aldehyde dehydrogenase family protein [Steroidobacteraceae bacterium]